MDIREIRSLILVARTGSILRAAERSCLTPGAVHKHLKTLEAELGVRLYRKTENGLELTCEGEIALPFFQEVIERRDAALAAIADCKDSARGVVRVGAGPSFASFMLPGIVARFRRRYPRVEVYVETGNAQHVEQQLKAGALDLAFALTECPAGEFAVLAEWEAEIGIVSALPNLPSPASLKRLAEAPFILFGQGSRMDRIVQRYLDAIGLRPKVIMRSDSAEAIKAAVKNRLGVALMFLWNANQELGSRSLRAIRTGAAPLLGRLALIKPKTSYTPLAIEAFAKMARGLNWKNLHPVESAEAVQSAAGSAAVKRISK